MRDVIVMRIIIVEISNILTVDSKSNIDLLRDGIAEY